MRIQPKPLADYPWFIRLIFRKHKRTYGEILTPGLLWGRSPFLFAALSLLYGALIRKSSPIEPALRSLLMTRVSQINHCPFCADINAKSMTSHGVSLDKVMAVESWRESPLFDATEKAALDYAETITHAGRAVDDQNFASLKEIFGDDGMVELTALIAFQNMSSKFNGALDVPPQGFCKMP